MIEGKVTKIHSDFYYVNSDNTEYECKLLQTIKKKRFEVVVGDNVVLEQIDYNSNQAFIVKILPRKNFISHPKAANLDKLIVVNAIKEPDLNFEQLDRYLAFAQYYNLDVAICFNKNDLSQDDEFIEKIYSMYEPLGYEIIFTSALDKIGIEDFEELIQDKTCVLCGSSGVGKTSLINAINTNLNLKTKIVSQKTQKGTHTTRHCELLKLNLSNGNLGYIVDTPGFSNLKFDFLMPNEVDLLFDEISQYKQECKFQDCLHDMETGCAVKAHIGEIDETRYQSYLEFVEEAKEYKEKVKYQGVKSETSHKQHHNKTAVKISSRKRESARNTQKQRIYKDVEDERID